MGSAELRKKFLGCSIREADVSINECLIENRSTEKAAHLLLLNEITRRGEHMAMTGENGAGDPPLERGEEGQGSLFKGNYGVAAPKLDAIGGRELINI